MELRDVINQMIAQHMKAEQLTDLRFGTVTSASPLEISINSSMAPLQSGVLYLTSAVVEKKIPVLSHAHDMPGLSHSHTVTGLGHQHNTGGLSHTHTVTDGNTSAALGDSYASDQQLTGEYGTSTALSGDVASANALTSVACIENGVTLPVEDGYIILNRGLQVGDIVLLLRVLRGQKFIVLSRVFEGG